jgi:hypothetical protein
MVASLATIPVACLCGLGLGWAFCWRRRRTASIVALLAAIAWVAIALVVLVYAPDFLSTAGAASSC